MDRNNDYPPGLPASDPPPFQEPILDCCVIISAIVRDRDGNIHFRPDEVIVKNGQSAPFKRAGDLLDGSDEMDDSSIDSSDENQSEEEDSGNHPKQNEIAYLMHEDIRDAIHGRVIRGTVLRRCNPDDVWTETAEQCAIKEMSWESIRNGRDEQMAENPEDEIAAMEHLLRFYNNDLGVQEVSSIAGIHNTRIIMPLYCLYDHQNVFTEDESKHFLRSILNGLECLQMAGLTHKDIRLENIMVVDELTVIIDMGMCLRIPVDFYGAQRRLINSRPRCGKQYYMAPEIYNKEPFDGRVVDMWAVGVCLFMILTSQKPWERPCILDQKLEHQIIMERNHKDENVEKESDKLRKGQAQTMDLFKYVDDDETTPKFMCAAVRGNYPQPTLWKEKIASETKVNYSEQLTKDTRKNQLIMHRKLKEYYAEKESDEKVSEEVDDAETTPNFMSAAVRDPATTHSNKKNTMESKVNYSEQPNQKIWETGKIPVASGEYRRSRTVKVIEVLKTAEIANIIFASNKARSIHAVYDKSTVKCKTSSYLKFTVRLLLPTQNAELMMVHVHRVSGCALAFRDEYQALQAVLDIRTPSSFQQKSLPDFDFMKGNYIPLEEGIIERSIEKSEKNLWTKMYDTRIITLQDLLLTTDPNSKETSSTACKLIVEKYSKILEYVVTDTMKGNKSGDNDDDSQEYLRSLSLNLLSNLLITESNNQALYKKAEEHQWTHTLIESLVLYVSQARNHPWNACLASKCLCLLAPMFNMYKGNDNVRLALESAEEYGRISHMQLEKEAQAALKELGLRS